VGEDPFVRALVVDERAEPRLLVPNRALAVFERNLSVDAGDIGAGQTQIGLAPAADRKQRLVDRDNAAAQRVGDDQPGTGVVWESDMRTRIIRRVAPAA
jgi:hypothetical protein